MGHTVQFTAVSPYLVYPDGDAAVEWLSRVLGFGPTQCVRDEGGRWTEGEIKVGDTVIGVSGSATNYRRGGDRALLIVHVNDVDKQYQHLCSMGVEVDPPKDEDYGPRSIHVTDEWGYRWYFWQGEPQY